MKSLSLPNVISMKKLNNVVKVKDERLEKQVRDTEFETKILDTLNLWGFVRVNNFIERIRQTTGKSKPTILRALSRLQQSNEIIVVKRKDFKKYSIEDTDKRAIYIGVRQQGELKVHVDSIFNILEKSVDIPELRICVNELRECCSGAWSNYRIDRDQLEVLISKLSIKDNEIRYGLLDIIFNKIYLGRVRPLNKDRFLAILRKLLKEYPPDSYKQFSNPKATIVYLLGMYNDYAIIESLERDAEVNDRETLNAVRAMYGLKFTANVIEDNKTALFNFAIKLKGKDEALNFINEVRRMARNEATFLKQNPDSYLLAIK